MKRVLSTFAIAGLGGMVSLGIYKAAEPESTTAGLATPTTAVKYVNLPNSSPEAAIDFTTAADRTIHTVVHIKTEYESEGNTLMNDPFQLFFGHRGQSPVPQQGSGSGVILSEDGYIVTNNHVIDRASKIEVTMNNRQTYRAEVVGKDLATDLALIKIDAKGLPFVAFGNSDNVKVGEWVLAVGNPFNLTSTVTAGIVSAKARNINILENDPSRGLFPIESYIQTDAAVNPGNSGGALVNSHGELIGINSAIASNTGSYAGYAFAVPANLVKKVTGDLAEFGTVQRAFLGISIRDIDSKLAEEKKINEFKGVFVSGLSEGGAAKEAGLIEGDIITKVGEISVNSSPELQEQVSRFRPGDKIHVSVLRNGKEKDFEIKLKNKNNTTDVIKKEKTEAMSTLGATFQEVTADEQKKLRIGGGVKIIQLSPGKLRSAGIKEGFIITSIDKKPVKSVEELHAILDGKQGGVLIEGVYPNGLRAYYGFGL